MADSEKGSVDKHPFSSDRPIYLRSEDLLGRTTFSERIAEAIGNWREKDSLILSVNGHWGDGKSSVKNMVLEVLKERPETTRPDIVEFNPWQWSDDNALSEVFFHEVLIKLGQLGSSAQTKETYRRWQEYSAYLQLTNTVFDSTLSIARLLFGLTGVMSLVLSVILPEWVRPLLGVVGAVVLIASLVTGFLEKIATPLTKLAELRTAKSKKTLAELKRSLTDSLSKLHHPIIIVMDDLDRLRKSEIQAVFKIIKANADFPNFIYLLFFQRDIIEKSLNEADIYSGAEYLEKIVQVAFSLPQIQLNRVHNILAVGIETSLRSEGLMGKVDESRWHDIFIPGLRHYFKNLRDVNRFLSTLSFHIGLLRVDEVFQVNPLDLISIEVLRQFEPGVYNSVYGNKDIFTEGSSDGRNDTKKKILTEIVDGSLEKDAAKTVLLRLFPNIRWAFENYHSSVGDDEYRELRICHPEVFDRYFQLRLPDGDISQAELEKALSLSGNRDAFRMHLTDLHRRGLLATFLDRFEAYKQQVDLENAVPFITAIFDIGDVLGRETGMFLLSESMHARRIIHWFLKTEKDKGKKKQHIVNSLEATTGTYLPIDWIRGELMRTEEKTNYPDMFSFEESEFEQLKQIGLRIINRAVNDGTLKKTTHLPEILYPWLEWGSPESVKSWVSQLIATDEGLKQFLRGFTQRVYVNSIGSYSTKIQHKIRPKSIENFVPFQDLLERVKHTDLSKLDAEDKINFEAVLEAEERLKNPEKNRDRWDD